MKAKVVMGAFFSKLKIKHASKSELEGEEDMEAASHSGETQSEKGDPDTPTENSENETKTGNE